MPDEKKAPARIRETRTVDTGFGHPNAEEDRVRSLAEGETVPEGAETVPQGTPTHGWQPVRSF